MNHCEDPDCASSQKSLVTTKCEELLDSGCDSPYLLGFLVELYKSRLEDNKEAERENLVKKVTGLCDRLAQVYRMQYGSTNYHPLFFPQDVDVVRCKYWTFISDCVTRKYAAVA